MDYVARMQAKMDDLRTRLEFEKIIDPTAIADIVKEGRFAEVDGILFTSVSATVDLLATLTKEALELVKDAPQAIDQGSVAELLAAIFEAYVVTYKVYEGVWASEFASDALKEKIARHNAKIGIS